jgi:hypothetical protein
MLFIEKNAYNLFTEAFIDHSALSFKCYVSVFKDFRDCIKYQRQISSV